MNKKDQIYNKFGGLCTYSGTPLEDDWQIDHIFPKRFNHYLKSEVMKRYYKQDIEDVNDMENLVPCQKLINHYKGGCTLEMFRSHCWRLGGIHKRLSKLPKNPRTERGKNHKAYLLKIAEYFGITPDKPFDGIFYFEKIKGDLCGKDPM